MRYPLLAALLAPAAALAQATPADTTRLHSAEEVAVPTPVPRADRQQWKLGFNNFRLDSYPFSGYYNTGPYYTRYGLHLAYERRLGRMFSVQAEASPAVVHVRDVGEADIQTRFGLRGQLQGRYYYNQERRRRLGHRTSGFSANYLALAVGSGLQTGPLRETPFYLAGNVPNGALDLALLYGIQRRLGRSGFVDFNFGATALLAAGGYSLNPNASLRVGLALPAAAPAAPVPADEVASLLPRAYAGAQVGVFSYRVHFAADYPFPPNTTVLRGNERWEYYFGQPGYYRHGYGSYTEYLVAALPYVYGGYYLAPRLAVQVGVQHAQEDASAGFLAIDAPDRQLAVGNVYAQHSDWAAPVQLRYTLTPVLRQRFQLDVLGGLTPVWAAVHWRAYEVASRQATDQVLYEFRRTAFGLHGTLGLAAEYGLGRRRRRVQAVLEAQLTRDLTAAPGLNDNLQGGASLGVRYRFGYR